MAESTGRNISCFIKGESAYGVPETLSSDDYVRVTTAPVTNSQLAAIPSEEKTPGRGLHEVFRGRPTTEVTVGCFLRGAPTGITPPRHGRLLVSAMGADPLVVDAASDVTGSTNQGVPLFVAGQTDGMFRPQIGEAASPLIALNGTAIYKSVLYRLASGTDARSKSLTFRCQPLEDDGAPSILSTGWKVNTLTIGVDGSGSPGTIEAVGPAARTYHGTGTIAEGGTGDRVSIPDTLTDDQPLNGIPAKVWFRRRPDDGSSPTGNFTEITDAFNTLTLELNNNQALRNQQATSLYAVGVVDTNSPRSVTLTFTTYAEADNTLYPDVKAGLHGDRARHYELFVAMGDQEGGRVGIYAPRVLFDLPIGDEGDQIMWTFTGNCLTETYGKGDSEIYLGLG